jgi:hypothetical protein
MRTLLLPLTLLTAGCWTPGPGERDPTLYPWDRPKPVASYCIVSLEVPGASGIAARGSVPSTGRITARGSVPTFEQVPALGQRNMELACTPADTPSR